MTSPAWAGEALLRTPCESVLNRSEGIAGQG
jgi:hypothetical protein